MNEVMDETDRAKAQADFGTDLALRLYREESGIKEAGKRVINEYCDHCGGLIPKARREANTATDILYCVDCQNHFEIKERLG